MSLPHVQSDMKVSCRTGAHLARSAHTPVPEGSLLLVIQPGMPDSASQVPRSQACVIMSSTCSTGDPTQGFQQAQVSPLVH